MTPTARDKIAAALRQRRAALLSQVADTEADLAAMAAERESELEERAQEDRLARLLARLDDRERREIDDIHAALQRLIDGTYERCEDCEEPIDPGRLRALPTARRCLECARVAERGTAAEAAVPPAARPAPPAPDLDLLSDREREEALRELVCQDGRVDTQELRIVCRHGVAHLEGAVPSEAEHDIVSKLLADVAGIAEVVDHLRVDELAWERGDRSPPARPAERPGFEPIGTEDVVESEELGVDFIPPARPGPDED